MSERTANRGGAVAGAILVTLGVAGLWFLLGDAPEPRGPETGSVPSASLATKAARTRQAARKAPQTPSPPQPPDGELEVAVFSENAPVAGAQVQVYAREPGDISVFPAQWIDRGGGVTGADGRWVMPAAPGSYYVTARAQELAPGYAAVVHPPGSAHTRVRLLLVPAVELFGTVLAKGTGEPISLAELVLTPPAFGASPAGIAGAPDEEGLVTTSSETGEFRFSGLAPGRYRLEARAPGYVPLVLPSAPVPFPGGTTLMMVRGGQLEGTVLSANGQPAPGAEVLAAGREQDLTALSDGDGRFSFEAPPGAYVLSAQRGTEAGALDPVTVAIGQRVQGLRLQLGAGASVSGKIVHADGSPVLGARVEASAENAPRGLETVSTLSGTDASGAFSLSPLAAGTYTLQVFMPEGTRFSHGPLTLTAGEHASVTLTSKEAHVPPHQGILCHVRDASNQPVNGIRVRATSLGPQAAAVPRSMEARTGANGSVRFTEVLPGPFRMEVLPDDGSPAVEQTLLVRQQAIGLCYFWIPGSAEAGGSMSIVEGRVLLPSGGPPEEPVQVEALKQKPSRQTDQGTASVDAQGHFRLAAPAGSYTLRLRRLRSPGCNPQVERQLQLEPGQHQELTLLLEPQEPDLRLQLVDAQGTPLSRTLVRVHLGSMEASMTDEQGRLGVCLPSSATRQQLPSLSLTVSTVDDSLSATAEVTSLPRELTLSLRPPAFIQGRIIDSRGAPVTRFTLDVLAPEGLSGLRTYEFMGDRFELPGLPSVPSLLIVTAEGMRGARYLQLRPEEHPTLEFLLHPAVSMTGRIIDAATRQPVASARVALPLFGAMTTGPDGRFEFRNLPAGELFLYIYRDAARRSLWSAKQLVRLAPDQANDVGDIVVPPRAESGSR